MNRADLRRDIFIVVGIYFLWTIIGASLFYVDSFVTEGADLAITPGGHLHRYQYFELFKELTPVVVLLPVAWVGYSFQRRISFVNDLRQFWPDLVEAVQHTVEYLRREDGDRRDYERTLTALRCRIDDARALFRRSAATDTGSGKYPYEGHHQDPRYAEGVRLSRCPVGRRGQAGAVGDRRRVAKGEGADPARVRPGECGLTAGTCPPILTSRRSARQFNAVHLGVIVT